MKTSCPKIILDLEHVTVIDFDEIPFPGTREGRNDAPLGLTDSQADRRREEMT
jgi:hypothetical protein